VEGGVMAENKKKKNRSTGITFNIEFDADIGEIDDSLWDEDYDPPPMVKPEKAPDENRSKN
jgi:hypothetical protein